MARRQMMLATAIGFWGAAADALGEVPAIARPKEVVISDGHPRTAFAASHSHAAPNAAASDVRPDDRQALRDVDIEQARLVQSGDATRLEALFHPSYVVHTPDGRSHRLDRILAMVRNGALTRERFTRTPEIVTVSGTTGVVIGVDRLEEAPPLARNGERTRRYTNVYVLHEGRWRLLARHFHFLP